MQLSGSDTTEAVHCALIRQAAWPAEQVDQQPMTSLHLTVL